MLHCTSTIDQILYIQEFPWIKEEQRESGMTYSATHSSKSTRYLVKQSKSSQA